MKNYCLRHFDRFDACLWPKSLLIRNPICFYSDRKMFGCSFFLFVFKRNETMTVLPTALKSAEIFGMDSPIAECSQIIIFFFFHFRSFFCLYLIFGISFRYFFFKKKETFFRKFLIRLLIRHRVSMFIKCLFQCVDYI